MLELKVTLETVTPLFLGGADNRQPEIRPPSVRGQLRYWLRAALGTIVGDDLTALKQAESEVFGSTDGTGAVGVRVWWLESKAPAPMEVNTLPHPSAEHPANMTGFPAGSKFQLQLVQRNDSNTWLAAISATLLMVSIGGLGRRSRRGWGTLRIVESDTSRAGLNEGWQEILIHRPNSVEAWRNYLDFSLQAAHEGIKPLCRQLNIKSKQPAKSYTIASPKTVRPIVVPKLYNTYTEAISDFGEAEHQWLQNNPSLIDSVGFAKRDGRQASPLWLRVFPVLGKNGSKNYILAAILFDISFTGSNYKAVSGLLKTVTNLEVPK